MRCAPRWTPCVISILCLSKQKAATRDAGRRFFMFVDKEGGFPYNEYCEERRGVCGKGVS